MFIVRLCFGIKRKTNSEDTFQRVVVWCKTTGYAEVPLSEHFGEKSKGYALYSCLRGRLFDGNAGGNAEVYAFVPFLCGTGAFLFAKKLLLLHNIKNKR